jgi:uridine kinase
MLIIGIAGGTGSGKTTVVRKILERLPEGEVVILPQDSYYRDSGYLPLEQRLEINFDHPDSIEFELLVKHLKDLRKGKPINQPIYSYLTCTRSEETIPIYPCHVIIIEGILVLTNPELRKMMDLKVFVDADADDRLIRVINRDIEERGRTVNMVMERYERTVKPMHLQFIEPSKHFADLIIPQGGNNHIAIDILTKYIENKLISENISLKKIAAED